MLKKLLIALILVFMHGVTADAQWRSSGEVVEDEAWRKENGDFAAMLILTNKPDEFFAAWDQPPDPDYKPELELATTAVRGDTVVAVVIFSGCKSNDEGNCNSTVDFRLLRPDGSEYAHHKDGELWTDKPAPAYGQLQVSIANLGFIVEDDDPFGEYTLQANVRDLVAKKSVQLEQVIEIIEKQ
jgi:hypothetical protein